MSDKDLQSVAAISGRKVTEFVENAVYDVKQTAKILRKSEKYVRNVCSRGLIRARLDRGGFIISGWQIRKFVEGVCEINE